jgi:hypothetical protein
MTIWGAQMDERKVVAAVDRLLSDGWELTEKRKKQISIAMRAFGKPDPFKPSPSFHDAIPSNPGSPGSNPGNPGSNPGNPGSNPGNPGSNPGIPASSQFWNYPLYRVEKRKVRSFFVMLELLNWSAKCDAIAAELSSDTY